MPIDNILELFGRHKMPLDEVGKSSLFSAVPSHSFKLSDSGSVGSW